MLLRVWLRTIGAALLLQTCTAIMVRAAEVPRIASDSTATATAVAFPTPEVRAWQIGLLRSDRLVHAGFSLALMSALGLATEDRRTAAAVTLTLGLGKELWDRHPSGSGFDLVDLAADATGVAIGAVLLGSMSR